MLQQFSYSPISLLSFFLFCKLLSGRLVEMAASSMEETPEWYQHFNSIHRAETAWILLHEQIQDSLSAGTSKGFQYILVDSLRNSHMYKLGFCFIKRFYTFAGPRKPDKGLGPELLPIGPLQRLTEMDGYLSDHALTKMENTWEVPSFNVKPFFLRHKDKEIMVRLYNTKRTSHSALNPKDCLLSTKLVNWITVE